MFGKRKENHEVQDPDVVKEKQNFSKDDIFRQLMEEYTSSKRNLLIKLRQKRITDAEFMDDVDNTLHKIDAVIDVKEQARTMFYQYVFSYFRLTSLIEDPEISDIHCIAYNKIRVKKKGKRDAFQQYYDTRRRTQCKRKPVCAHKGRSRRIHRR